jgi:hypothetical protein
MEITTCPECDAPAEIRGRSVWESTDGPIEHIRVECVRRHWFLMSAESLAAAHREGAPRAAAPVRESARRPR